MIGSVCAMKTMFKKLAAKLGNMSFYYKINILVSGMILVSGLLIGIIMLRTTSQLLENQLDKRGSEIANSLASLSANDILLEDYFSLSDRLDKTKSNNEEVRYIMITDSTGHILVSTFNKVLPVGIERLRLPEDEAARPWIKSFDSNEGVIREILFPIEKGTIGYIRIGMSENITQSLLAEKVRDIILAVLSICTLAAVCTTWLSYLLVQPIRILVDAVGRIQQGDYNVRLNVKRTDETGNLARAFDGMAHGLRKKNRENRQLLREIQAKEALRLSLIRKLFTVQEDEQRRLSRELHDETGQCMASLLAYIKVLHTKLTTEEQRNLLSEARSVTVSVLEGIRKMAVELRPPALDYLGVVAAMEKYIVNFNEHASLRVRFVPPPDKLRISNDVAVSLYRILQESLTNIARHAEASHAAVVITQDEKFVCMKVSDDGRGMAADAIEIARQNNRLGLFGMQERTELLGGTFQVESAKGEGTAITVILPRGSDECFGKTENTAGR